MSEALAGFSSMATKHVLADLSRDYAQKTGRRVSVISMGAGSVAVLARPALPKTDATSGKDLMMRSVV